MKCKIGRCAYGEDTCCSDCVSKKSCLVTCQWCDDYAMVCKMIFEVSDEESEEE